MQDLNNEMDDLFRKAVELYPLKPCDSQWDMLSAKIKSKKRWGLFLPIVFRQNKFRMSVFLSVLVLMPAIIISLSPLANKISTLHTPKKITLSNIPATVFYEKPKKRITSPPGISSSIKYENIIHDKKYIVSEEFLSLYTDQRISVEPVPEPVPLSFSDILFTELSESNNRYSRVETPNDNDRRIPEVRPVYLGKPLNFDNQPEWRTLVAEHNNQTLQHLTLPRRQGFYTGVQAGPLLSQVKNQGITTPGFDFGLLMGYSFSKRLSLETGIMRTRQYFTAGGDYLREILNMGGAKSLEGSRNAISIPFKLKYNLINGSSGSFFLTAGVSSVVGVNDHIVITVNYLPVPSANKIDLGTPSYLPAYMNFSLGYDYKMGNCSNIRIEPYLEIPTNSTAGNSFKTRLPDHYVHVFNSGIHITISGFIH